MTEKPITPEAEKAEGGNKPLKPHEELLARIAANPRFRVVESFGQGFVIVGAKPPADPTTE